MKQIDIKAIINTLNQKQDLVDIIGENNIYWGLPKEEDKANPYVVINIVSDIPDPIKTQTRIEIRIIANNNKILNSQILEIDKIIKETILENVKFGDFEVFNIVVEEGQSFFGDKNRKEFIRDYLFYFIN